MLWTTQEPNLGNWDARECFWRRACSPYFDKDSTQPYVVHVQGVLPLAHMMVLLGSYGASKAPSHSEARNSPELTQQRTPETNWVAVKELK